MSWKRHVQAVPQGAKLKAAIDRLHNNLDSQATPGGANKYSSYLPEVYAGPPNRIERYGQYENMDRDPEVAGALDTIADFSTQTEEQETTAFNIQLKGEATDAEVEILNTALDKWSQINKFKQKIWKMFRSTTMYGDQFFVRDPETFEWHWVNHEKVESIIANEADGKRPDQYIVQDMDLNIQTLVASLPTKNPNRGMSGWAGTSKNAGTQAGTGAMNQPAGTNRFQIGQTSSVIDAEHIIHLSMTEGLDSNWPFGNSILESVFKPFKQKELLEDSVIIYRVQRAPERRVFYIDVGTAPPHKAMEFVNRIKNEIHQRRIPTQNGGGSNIMDAAYNPLCLSLDTTVPLLDGRTLSLEDLITEHSEGKENWTYSCDPITGKIVPGNITWAGVTRKNTQVLKLHLDDGSSITVTPDHKIPVLGKGFVEAQNLTEDDSLISFKTKEQSLVSSDNERTYTQVYDHEENDWVYVHRMVAGFFRHIKKHQEFTYLPENKNAHKSVVHHKDYNRYNNDPRNLQWMNHSDHISYHQDTNMWKHLTEEESSRIRNKISNTVKQRWADGTYDVNTILEAQKKAVWLRNNDPKMQEQYSRNASKSRLEFLKNNPNFKDDVLIPNLSNYQENCPNQEKVYTFDQLQAVYDLAKKNDFKLKFMLTDTVNHNSLLREIKNVNKPKEKHNFKIQTTEVTQQVIYNTIRHFGYKNWMDFKRKKEEFNHRVVKIEWLAEKQDTGTITIDGQERWHNYHTFPVNNSIFVKNSIIEDYFFPATCLSLDTEIPLLDGRILTLNECISEYEEGNRNFVYGLNNMNHEMEPAEIMWAGVTRKNTEVYEVKLDNGEVITATPDHRFIMRDGEEVEAQHLKPNDSLMPLELIEGYSGPKQCNKKYMRYRSNNTGTIKFVHAEISKKPAGRETQVHHLDFNSRNNNPTNLQVMETSKHINLHKSVGTYSLTRQWNDPIAREKLIKGMRSLYDNASKDFKEKIKRRNSKNATSAWNKKTALEKEENNKQLITWQTALSKQKTIRYDKAMFLCMVASFDKNNNSISKLSKALREDINFQTAFKSANKNIKRDKNNGDTLLVTDTTLNKIVNVVGFRTFGEWKMSHTSQVSKFSNNCQNHKVVSVTKLVDRIDTGDITIKSESNSHWFALSAGIYVHNSEGRGSKVETLPGGDQLGEIDDLKYFNNKLLRGLRVPSSYLPFGPEDGQGSFNDGRVGTAYMQEFRFAKYLKRLQNLLNPIFDREFKIFLRHRGVQIDSGLFDLELHEPQNFAKFRQIEIDAAQIGVWQPLSEVGYLSKRFVMQRFLNLSEDEILENERMWKEENPDLVQSDTSMEIGQAPGGGLSAVGVRPEGGDDFDAGEIGDETGMEDTGEESPISGTDEEPAEAGDLDL